MPRWHSWRSSSKTPVPHCACPPAPDVDPAARRALHADFRELREKISQALPVLIQSLRGWAVLAIKINRHHGRGRDDGKPERPFQSLGNLKPFHSFRFISWLAGSPPILAGCRGSHPSGASTALIPSVGGGASWWALHPAFKGEDSQPERLRLQIASELRHPFLITAWRGPRRLFRFS